MTNDERQYQYQVSLGIQSFFHLTSILAQKDMKAQVSAFISAQELSNIIGIM
jgi:hypothetical protein